jgi:hypothetical protein
VVTLPVELDRIIAAEAAQIGARYGEALVDLLRELLPPAEECELALMAAQPGVH